MREFAISETQKFGHATYFWNGNKSGKFSEELETYVEIPSDVVPFEQRPWMKCAEITDRLIAELEGGAYKYYRVNFPNGDMVGHTGSLLATRCAMEALDIQLARILEVIDKLGGVALITADHGNADEMYEIDKKSGQPKVDKAGHFKAKTSHTLNPVPCIIYDNTDAREHYTVKPDTGRFGLSYGQPDGLRGARYVGRISHRGSLIRYLRGMSQGVPRLRKGETPCDRRMNVGS